MLPESDRGYAVYSQSAIETSPAFLTSKRAWEKVICCVDGSLVSVKESLKQRTDKAVAKTPAIAVGNTREDSNTTAIPQSSSPALKHGSMCPSVPRRTCSFTLPPNHRRGLLHRFFISLQVAGGYTPAVSPISSVRSIGDVSPLQGTADRLGSLWAAYLACESNRWAIIGVVDYGFQDTYHELHPDDPSEEGSRVTEVAITHQQKTGYA